MHFPRYFSIVLQLGLLYRIVSYHLNEMHSKGLHQISTSIDYSQNNNLKKLWLWTNGRNVAIVTPKPNP